MSKRMCACVQVVVGELTANFRPNYIVDLGAGLGTSTDYLMRAAPAGASVYAVDLWSAPFAAKVSFWLNTTCRGGKQDKLCFDDKKTLSPQCAPGAAATRPRRQGRQLGCTAG